YPAPEQCGHAAHASSPRLRRLYLSAAIRGRSGRRPGVAQVCLAGRSEEVARGQTHGEAEEQAQAAHPDPVDPVIAGLHEPWETVARQREEHPGAAADDGPRRIGPASEGAEYEERRDGRRREREEPLFALERGLVGVEREPDREREQQRAEDQSEPARRARLLLLGAAAAEVRAVEID